VIIETNSKMGDEFDVDDLLEAPYKVKNEPEIAHFFTSSKSPAISICIVLSIADWGLVKGVPEDDCSDSLFSSLGP